MQKPCQIIILDLSSRVKTGERPLSSKKSRVKKTGHDRNARKKALP